VYKATTTNALDMVAESKMYSLLCGMGQVEEMTALGLTFVSVGH
jgi:hypothetical protein